MRNDNNTQHTILIATTNPGKFEEFVSEFKDLPFQFIDLKKAGLDTLKVDEPYETTWENALHKAKIYAAKSNMLTIAEDTGFFIEYLNGEPGVNAKHFAGGALEARNTIITALTHVPTDKRGAYFETSGVLIDPVKNATHMFYGRVDGQIGREEIGSNRQGMMYETIFFHPPSQKFFSELSMGDKSLISHRGQVVNQIKIFLQKHYGFRQIMVPLALIVKDNKLLMLKRRDSRPEFNNKWEFPGGGVEKGESVDECIKRECLEETGFVVDIKERLPNVLSHVEEKWNYQVFLVSFICTIKSGTLKLMDNENSAAEWFTLDDAVKQDLLPLNKAMIQDSLGILSKYCK